MLISVGMDSTTKENCSKNKPVPEKTERKKADRGEKIDIQHKNIIMMVDGDSLATSQADSFLLSLL